MEFHTFSGQYNIVLFGVYVFLWIEKYFLSSNVYISLLFSVIILFGKYYSIESYIPNQSFSVFCEHTGSKWQLVHHSCGWELDKSTFKAHRVFSTLWALPFSHHTSNDTLTLTLLFGLGQLSLTSSQGHKQDLNPRCGGHSLGFLITTVGG